MTERTYEHGGIVFHERITRIKDRIDFMFQIGATISVTGSKFVQARLDLKEPNPGDLKVAQVQGAENAVRALRSLCDNWIKANCEAVDGGH